MSNYQRNLVDAADLLAREFRRQFLAAATARAWIDRPARYSPAAIKDEVRARVSRAAREAV